MGFVFGGCILIGGCAPKVAYIPFKKEPEVVSPKEIKILTQKPREPYKVLGVLEVQANGWTSKEGILRILKRKAWVIDADALMDLEYENATDNTEQAAQGAYASGALMWSLPKRKINNLFASASYVVRAKAIKYLNKPNQTKKGGDGG